MRPPIVFCFLAFYLPRSARFECMESHVTICESVDDLRTLKDDLTNVLVQTKCKTCTGSDVLSPESFQSTPKLDTVVILSILSKIEPGTFSQLKKLRQVRIVKNKLSGLPRKLFAGLPQLYRVELGANTLKSVPSDLVEGSPVTTVTLQHNKLTSIEDGTFDRPTLRHVKLDHNLLTALGEKAFNRNLQHLDLSFNKFRSINGSAFAHLSKLRTLILKNNRFVIVNPIPSLKSLEKLDLSNNEVQFIAENAFTHYPDLRELYLQYNKLVYLDPRSFGVSSPIQTLYLHANYLTNLMGLDTSFDQLKNITIGGNPWSCSCLVQIWDNLSKNGVELEGCDMGYMGDGMHPVCLVTGDDSMCFGNESIAISMEHPANIPLVTESYSCT